jgi:hypothetical protein
MAAPWATVSWRTSTGDDHAEMRSVDCVEWCIEFRGFATLARVAHHL